VDRPRIRLLALDIDGTLLTSERVVSPRTRAALAAARTAGVKLLLVTGRRLPSARRIARDLGGDVPLVLHNGALVLEGDELLRACPLPRAVARRATELGLALGAEPVLHCGLRGEGRVVVRTQARHSRLVRYYLERAGPDVEEVADLLVALEGEDPIQVMFGGPREEVESLRGALERRLRDQARVERSVYPANDLAILEVLERTVGKADAVAFLQERWGISAGETLAIGDNWNDREMIVRAGLGFVMGNADPELRRLGPSVLPSNDEDGVALAVETHVLGKRKGGESHSPPFGRG
jgi:Cof subfamily protein (haloacid dehalogenase superfamily)